MCVCLFVRKLRSELWSELPQCQELNQLQDKTCSYKRQTIAASSLLTGFVREWNDPVFERLDTNSFFILCHIEFVYPLRRPSPAIPPPHICLCWAALSLSSSSCCCNVRGVFVKSQMLMCGLKTPFEVLVNFIPECCCCVADGCCMHFGFRFPLEA